jgi:hypothetical protein
VGGGSGGFFVRQLIGLTDEVLEKYQSRQDETKDDRPVAKLYNRVMDMKEFGLSPFDYSRLSRIDKKVLAYYRIMERYYFEFSPDQIKFRQEAKEREREAKKAKLMGMMPKLRR